MKKKLLSVVALLLVALLALSGCSAHGKTMIKAGDEKISVNLYQLYLSRMKGELALAGHDVNSAAFWKATVDANGMTRNEQFTNRVFEGLRYIAASLILYEKEGLELDKSVEDDIDAWIETLIDTVGGGSKKEFNSILSAYGANVTVLRDSAIIDAKIAQLKTHLYGSGGSLIADTAMEQFYKQTYYRGQQMLIADYYYDHDQDEDGRMIYYQVDGEGNLKTDSFGNLLVAYDKVNGTEDADGVWRKYGVIAYETDPEKAKPSKDEARDSEGYLIYYQVDGEGNYLKGQNDELLVAYAPLSDKVKAEVKDGVTVHRKWVVAYDDENGEPKYKLNSEGNRVMKSYSSEEMERRLWMALEIKAACMSVSDPEQREALFEENMSKWSDNQDFNQSFAPNGMYFSAGSYINDDIFSTFSIELAKLEVGEMEILTSDSGYYIIMRCELDSGAWSEEENSRWFGTMRTIAMEYLLQNAAEPYLAELKINEKLKNTVDITMVAANRYY